MMSEHRRGNDRFRAAGGGLLSLTLLAALGCGESESERNAREQMERRNRAAAAQQAQPRLEQAQITNSIAAARRAIAAKDQASLTRAVADLEKLGDKAVEQLINDLGKPDKESRLSALTILREMGPQAKAALPKVEAVARENADPEVKKAAAEARSKIAPGP